jgi:nitrite reductase/ring-hydroxylating ferredoxin subunit
VVAPGHGLYAAGVPEVLVPGAAALSEGETRVFEVIVRGRPVEAFLLKYRGALHCYLNECPHWSIELDLGDGHFYDAALDRIYCKNHGALFFPATGECETGPCLGRSLVRLQIRPNSTDVVVEVP